MSELEDVDKEDPLKWAPLNTPEDDTMYVAYRSCHVSHGAVDNMGRTISVAYLESPKAIVLYTIGE